MPITNDNQFDDVYIDLIATIIHRGVRKEDRTGTGTMSVFGHQMRFDLSEGFPLITVKKTLWKPIVHELLWFLKGDTNVRYLKEHGVNIWDSWVKEGTAEYRPMTDEEIVKEISTHFGSRAKFWQRGAFERDGKVGYEYMMYNETLEDGVGVPCSPGTTLEELYEETFQRQPKKLTAGELGPVYGAQWRSWPCPKIELIEDQKEKLRYLASGLHYGAWLRSGKARAFVKNESIDQISRVIEMMKSNPDSRRLIVSAWNPALVDEMALPPCHALFQFYCEPLSIGERAELLKKSGSDKIFMSGISGTSDPTISEQMHHSFFDDHGVPQHRLSCHLYQRKSNCAFVA